MRAYDPNATFIGLCNALRQSLASDYRLNGQRGLVDAVEHVSESIAPQIWIGTSPKRSRSGRGPANAPGADGPGVRTGHTATTSPPRNDGSKHACQDGLIDLGLNTTVAPDKLWHVAR
jgi:hypothetical protein